MLNNSASIGVLNQRRIGPALYTFYCKADTFQNGNQENALNYLNQKSQRAGLKKR